MADLCDISDCVFGILDGIFGILDGFFGIWVGVFESGWVGRIGPGGRRQSFKAGFAQKITSSPHCGEKLLQIIFFEGSKCSQTWHLSLQMLLSGGLRVLAWGQS